MKFIQTADVKKGDVLASGRVLAVRRTAKTTFITVNNTVSGGVNTYPQPTNTKVALVEEGDK